MTTTRFTKSLALALLGAAFFSLSACDKKADADGGTSHMEKGGHDADGGHKDEHNDGDKHEDGDKHAMAKKVAVEVNATGYKPDMVMAKAGEPITIVFTRITDEGCGQKLLIPSEGIEKELPLNKPVEITFTPKKSGNLGFSCGMKMMKGTIMVH